MLRERADLLRLVSRESQTNPVVAAALAGLMLEGTQVISAYLEARIAANELRPHDTTVPARGFFWALVTMHLAQAPQTASRRPWSTFFSRPTTILKGASAWISWC